MSTFTSSSKWLGTLPLIALLFSIETNAKSATANVALGEVSVADSHARVETRDVRALAESAMGRARWPSDLKHVSVVSVSVVSMERAQDDHTLTCLVSAALRDEKTGNVYAVVESRATREQKSSSDADDRAAVGVALESVIFQLPAVVR